ncbi:hypothetical protein CONCODRAFT_11778 [Conidiobolus coronatus NRRL 28638]|uniref:G-protein coupled receptors family 1 profile domain-containing protein n=1 Tax=Conidiobolus coronatus (strain ATCC 28846 / CBS 209.66 / NRRL 28638) TaxID=796925 RepID=A0A137NUH0_CONC2|nr:hypothetical protein CONCODRAFT_11778 [Conidiobolus coronatus NRRL 28638]|eukprot:KXN66397.1 hypothetical protein CONCODRAFT_11778 [Conidiobolus coronatus NRRL 28638]
MSVDIKLASSVMIFDILACFLFLFNGIMDSAGLNSYLAINSVCNLNGFLVYFLPISSISIVGVLSLERCLLIVYKKKYSGYFYSAIVGCFILLNILLCLVCWLYQGFRIAPISVYCSFDTSTKGGLAGSALAVVSVGLSDIFVMVAYPLICIARVNHSRKMKLELGLNPDKVNLQVRSTIYKSLALILFSAITNGPYLILVLMSWADHSKISPGLDFVQAACATSSTFINTLILLNMQPELWSAIQRLWRLKSDSDTSDGLLYNVYEIN